jgi:tyrosine-protein kinase Etk/Wzc
MNDSFATPRRDVDYWADLLVRRRTIALETAAVVFGLIAIGTLLWPPTYQSSAEILVQDKRAQYLVSPDLQEDTMAKQAVVARPVTQEDLNSEVELLTSNYLIKQAIDGLTPPASNEGSLMSGASFALNLPLMGYAVLHDTPAMPPADRWAAKLERNVHPSVIKLSDVIEVTFRSHDPQWSHDFLARLIDHYLEYHAGLSADPQAQKFFNQQAQLLQTKLDASTDQLRQFEVQNGITDLPAQKQALVTRLSDLQIQLNHAGAEIAASHEQIAALGSQLKQNPERIGKEVRSVQNGALTQLKPQVMQLKAERAELLSRYQPDSQRIQEIDAKLAAAQRILDSENHLEVQEKSSDLNPVWVTLDTSLEQAKTSAASGEATQNALQGEIEKTDTELTQITNNGVVLDRLERQVAADKEAYLAYVRKSEEARTAQALNLSKILNVSVAQPASTPLRPVYPKVWLNLLVGLMLAALMSVGAAFWEEEQDDRIFSAASIYEASGLQTVAVFREEA